MRGMQPKRELFLLLVETSRKHLAAAIIYLPRLLENIGGLGLHEAHVGIIFGGYTSKL